MFEKNKGKIYRRVKNKKRGAVLFIAVTVSSLVLVIGLGILNIMTKEMFLSSLSTRSREAFYAADFGIECALFWDFVEFIDDKHSVDGTYSTTTFAIDENTYNQRNLGNIGLESFGETKFNPFCAEQSAAHVFGTGVGTDQYLKNFFGYNTVSGWDDANGIAETRFAFFPNKPVDLNNPEKLEPCTLVIIKKKKVGEVIETEINSAGFSSCDDNDQRRVSRGVLVKY